LANEETNDESHSTSIQAIPPNLPDDGTYNHIASGLTRAIVTDNTYSHIPNTTETKFDNTYSHVPTAYSKTVKKGADNTEDPTYNHLGEPMLSRKAKHFHNRKTDLDSDSISDTTYSHLGTNSNTKRNTQTEYKDNTYNHLGEALQPKTTLE